MATWHLKHGKFWMLQWSWDWWFSLGIHLDLKQRKVPATTQSYAPYVDLHIGCLIVSLGYHPYYSSAISANCIGRGGEIVG